MKDDGRDIRRLLTEGTTVERAMQKAVRESLRKHKQAGNPVAEWRDGKVVWIPPEKLQIRTNPSSDRP
jgi:hypothetical protein